jgi:hypothetical protein
MHTYFRAMMDFFKPRVKYVLIHQMGKVASQTIEQTIRAVDATIPIDRLHFLHPSNIQLWDQVQGVDDLPGDYTQSVRHQMRSGQECVRGLEEHQRQAHRVCVLTGCRDPLDHVIASVFQNLDIYVPQVTLDPTRGDFECTLVDSTFHEMFVQFKKSTLGTSWREQVFARLFNQALTWFDKEFTTVHGVDLYQHKPNKHGLLVLDQKSTRYILYKLETLEQQLPNVLKLIPGLPRRIPAVHRNRAQEKPYAALYSLFRKRFTPTPAMIDHFYHSRYFQHFYAGAKPRFAPQSAHGKAA